MNDAWDPEEPADDAARAAPPQPPLPPGALCIFYFDSPKTLHPNPYMPQKWEKELETWNFLLCSTATVACSEALEQALNTICSVLGVEAQALRLCMV